MSLMSLFDIFLYPTHFEAYGIVFLEAMSFKTPILSYDDGSAIRDTIGGGGLTVPYRNTNKLKMALDLFVNDSEMRRYYGETGYLQVTTRNDPKYIANKYEDIYEKVLNNKTVN
jgi:glycosyltransferase involved in cell wall biosynthesis